MPPLPLSYAVVVVLRTPPIPAAGSADPAVNATCRPAPASQARPSSGDSAEAETAQGDEARRVEDLQRAQSVRRNQNDKALCEEAARTVGRMHVEHRARWRRLRPPFAHPSQEFRESQSACVEMAQAAERNPAWREPTEPTDTSAWPTVAAAYTTQTTGRVWPDLFTWSVVKKAVEQHRQEHDAELCRLAAREAGHKHAVHVLGGGGWRPFTQLRRLKHLDPWAFTDAIDSAAECYAARVRGVERDARDAAYCRPEALPAEAHRRMHGWGWQPIRQRLSDHPVSDVRAVLMRELGEADAAFREMDRARRAPEAMSWGALGGVV